MNHKISKDGKAWERDDSKLTEEQLELLEAVHFPKYLKRTKAVQKRIAKLKGGGIFVKNNTPSLEDIRYVPISKNIALREVAKDFIDPRLPAEEKQRKRQYVEDNAKNNARENIYFDGFSIEEEMHAFLNKYGKPTPTKSMQKAESKTKVKSLSPKQKGKVKKLVEDGYTLEEMANELDVDKARIKKYLTKLNSND